MLVGCDTGLHNFSISFTNFSNGVATPEYSVILTNTIRNLTNHPIKDKRGTKKNPKEISDLSSSKKRFQKEVDGLIKEYKPTNGVLERFQSRGRGGNATIEMIAFQNALVFDIFERRKVIPELVIASQWKNSVNRNCPIDLDTLYEEAKQTWGLKDPNHHVDSSLLSIYQVDRKFECLKTKPKMKKWMKILGNAIEQI